MKTPRQIAEALAAFDTEHGQLILTALDVYEERMREAAGEALAGSLAPEPEPAPAGSGTISLRPTPGGFSRMASLFEAAASSADQARKAYEALTEMLPEEDWL